MSTLTLIFSLFLTYSYKNCLPLELVPELIEAGAKVYINVEK